MDNKIIERIESIEKELSGIKEELHNQNREKEPVVHLGANARIIRDCLGSLRNIIENNDLVIGDKLQININGYDCPVFVIVNIDNDGKYYLMPTSNLDIVQMHCGLNWESFEDTDMYLERLQFFKTVMESIDNFDEIEVTLASTEEIFDKEAFPYFKALIKEGVLRYAQEFGKDSQFWLRTQAPSSTFAVANDSGFSYRYTHSCWMGFRPLIIIGRYNEKTWR